MSDLAVDLARALYEDASAFSLDDRGNLADAEFRHFLRLQFPDITQEEIRRGLEIAVEMVLMDGRRA